MWELTGMDMPASLPALDGGDAFAKVRSLRRERGETGEQFGQVVGLSKGKVSELESGAYRPGVAVVLLIEQLSAGRIDAAELNDDVKASRHGLPDSAGGEGASNGQSDEESGQVAA